MIDLNKTENLYKDALDQSENYAKCNTVQSAKNAILANFVHPIIL